MPRHHERAAGGRPDTRRARAAAQRRPAWPHVTGVCQREWGWGWWQNGALLARLHCLPAALAAQTTGKRHRPPTRPFPHHVPACRASSSTCARCWGGTRRPRPPRPRSAWWRRWASCRTLCTGTSTRRPTRGSTTATFLAALCSSGLPPPLPSSRCAAAAWSRAPRARPAGRSLRLTVRGQLWVGGVGWVALLIKRCAMPPSCAHICAAPALPPAPPLQCPRQEQGGAAGGGHAQRGAVRDGALPAHHHLLALLRPRPGARRDGRAARGHHGRVAPVWPGADQGGRAGGGGGAGGHTPQRRRLCLDCGS